MGNKLDHRPAAYKRIPDEIIPTGTPTSPTAATIITVQTSFPTTVNLCRGGGFFYYCFLEGERAVFFCPIIGIHVFLIEYGVLNLRF